MPCHHCTSPTPANQALCNQCEVRERRIAKRGRKRDRDFLGVDGEAIDGTYSLLAASDKTGAYYRSIETPAGERLATVDCLDFLVDTATESGLYLFSFAFGYDVTNILHDLPRKRLRELSANGETRVRRGAYSYHLQYVGRNKPFKVSKYHRLDDENAYLGNATVFDVWGFVQSSFVKWVDGWGLATTPEEIAFLAEMKAGRSTFSEAERERIKEYNRLELKLIAKGAEYIRSLFDSAGIPLAQFNGAGSAAEALLRKYKVKNHLPDTLNKRFETASWFGYFGGRIEAATIGPLGDGYMYDINSAYPAAMPDLPCMDCGDWTQAPIPSRYILRRVRWDTGGRVKFGPFPFRLWKSKDAIGDFDKSYTVIFPQRGEGWVWHHEYDTIRRLHPEYDIETLEHWAYVERCDHRPLWFVPKVYDERQRLKAAGDPKNIPLKLGLNSLYGKFAQRVGNPAFQCLPWAGMITSYCRATLYEAIALGGENVEFLQTDSVFSRVPLDLELSKKLGAWGGGPVEEMTVLQAGVYRYTENGKVREKYRGFDPGVIDFDGVVERANASGKGIFYQEKQRATRLIPFGIASLSDIFWPDRGRFVTMERTLSLQPKTKRSYGKGPLPRPTEAVADYRESWTLWTLAAGGKTDGLDYDNGES